MLICCPQKEVLLERRHAMASEGVARDYGNDPWSINLINTWNGEAKGFKLKEHMWPHVLAAHKLEVTPEQIDEGPISCCSQ